MSIVAARKQLQKELLTLGRQSQRIQAALQALNGSSAGTAPRKKFKMSAAARRRISEGIRKAKAAKAAKQRVQR